MSGTGHHATAARRFKAAGASVRGASHRRKEVENQDAISWHRSAGDGLPLVMAVSDGHGSAPHFRSREGSRLAVEVAVEVGLAFVRGCRDRPLERVRALAQKHLTGEIERRWKRRVEAQLARDPLPPSAPAVPEDGEAGTSEERAAAAVDEDTRRYTPYGATLLLVVVTRAWIVFLQLGDGDIIAVGEDGVAHLPLPPDPRLQGNATTSLCRPEARRDFRVAVEPLEPGGRPELVLLATDGYGNSFASDAALLEVAQDYLARIRRDGLELVDSALEGWLAKATEDGSGDDITVGLIHASATSTGTGGLQNALEERMEALGKNIDELRSRVEAGIRLYETQQGRQGKLLATTAFALATLAVFVGAVSISGLKLDRWPFWRNAAVVETGTGPTAVAAPDIGPVVDEKAHP